MIHYIPELYKQITNGKIDPTDIITHRLPLEKVEHAYEIFDKKVDQVLCELHQLLSINA